MDSFTVIGAEAEREAALIGAAKGGDRRAMEDLVRLHQPWVFNLVLRMVANYHDAEDVTQDVLGRACAKLASFRGESAFRTWLYRIAVNRVLDLKETREEALHRLHFSGPADDRRVELALGSEPADPKALPADLALLAGEAMVKCTIGMLLCLDRRQRLVFILGGILGVEGKVAASILDMGEDAYRQALSRSRQRLWNYLDDRCGLVNPGRPCTCRRSVPANLRSGYIDPLHILFDAEDSATVRGLVTRTREGLDRLSVEAVQDLYRSHPLQTSPDFSRKVVAILGSEEARCFLDAPPRA